MNAFIDTAHVSEELTKAATDFFQIGSLAFLLGAIIMLAISSLGILYVVTVLAPGLTGRASESLRERGLLCFLAGILVVCPGVLAMATLKAHPKIQGIVALVYVFLMLAGYAASAENLGLKLFRMSGRQGTRASHLAAGWLVFFPAAFFPVLGWFLLMPWFTLSGLGSLALAPFRSAPPLQSSGCHTIEG